MNTQQHNIVMPIITGSTKKFKYSVQCKVLNYTFYFVNLIFFITLLALVEFNRLDKIAS